MEFSELLAKAEQGDAASQFDVGKRYYDGEGVEQNFEQAVFWYIRAAEQGYAAAQNSLGYCYLYGKGVEQNYEKAIYWYTKSAEQGYATAQRNLGLCYEKGQGVQQSYEQAVYWYTKSAEQGYALAQNNLGICYEKGQGVEQNYEQAVYWYTKAAEQGLARAQCNLGYCYYNGQGVQKSYEQAAYWFTKSAEQGYARAQYNLGVCYKQGQGVEQSYEQAIYWYTKSAERGYDCAQCNLGYCYESGNGVQQSYEQAVFWYTKSAEQGYAGAQLNLGYCYDCGNGVERNYEQAVYWYTKSAEQGYADAQCNLGYCYESGNGVQQNYEQAVYWYTKSAEQGYARAQCNLGKCYYYGQGVEKNYEQAVCWLTKSVEQGYAQAEHNLGVCYEKGRGVEQNYEQAVYWYKKAANQDNADSQCNLGYCYESGNGVKPNYQQAVYWYTKSAKQGDANAQCNLGLCYENGKGVEKNYEQAVYWYTKSAEQGYAEAQYNLGYCYENGQGVKQSYERAVYWYTKSAEQGNADAQYQLGFLCVFNSLLNFNYKRAVYWYTKAAKQGHISAQVCLGVHYERGLGVKADVTEALKWYKLAAEQGDEDSAEAYDRLYKENRQKLEREFAISNSGKRYDLFVSWNHNDKAFKDALIEGVESYDFDRTGKRDGKVFAHYRAWDSDRDASGVIEDCIRDVVNGSKFFVSILSRNSICSNWVAKEAKMFLEKIDAGKASSQNLFVVYLNEPDFDVAQALRADKSTLTDDQRERYEIFGKLLDVAGKFACDGGDGKLVNNLCEQMREALEAEALVRYRDLQCNLSPFAITLKNISANSLSYMGRSDVRVKSSLSYDDGYVERQLLTEEGAKDVEEIFDEGRNLFIVGEGGTGKSLFVSQLVRKNFDKNLFFVRVNFSDEFTVRNFGNSNSLTELANAELNRCLADDEYHFAEPLVRARNNDSNKIVFVFDGLDEIDFDARARLCQMVGQYARSHADDRFVFTSRTDDVLNKLREQLGDVRLCELRPFDAADCEKLFDNIAKNATFDLRTVGIADGISGKTAANEQKLLFKKGFFALLEMIEDDIKKNPMLLSNLIFIYLYNRGNDSDRYNKYGLLSESVKIFLNDLEEDRRILDRFPQCKRFLSRGKLNDLLETVAYRKLSRTSARFDDLVVEYYKQAKFSDEDAEELKKLGAERVGEDVFEYLSSRGIMSREQITHDIFTSFFACRYVYRMVYALKNDGIEDYVTWQDGAVGVSGRGALDRFVSPNLLGSGDFLWQDAAVDLIMKLDSEIHAVCHGELNSANPNFEVFDVTLTKALSEQGFAPATINTLQQLAQRDKGLFFAQFVRSYLKG